MSEEQKVTAVTHDEISHLEVTPLDLDDPHRAAIENAPEKPEKLSLTTFLAVLSLAPSLVGPLVLAWILTSGILVQIGQDLGNDTDITWIPNAWSVSSSVAFALAGRISDIFGRRWTIIFGQVTSIAGLIVAATAQKVSTLVAAEAVIGFGCGHVIVAWAGISELLPNKYRNIGVGFTETLVTIPWGAGNVIFPALFLQNTKAGWRWIFYIALIYCGVSLVGIVLWYFPPSRPQYNYETSRWQDVKDIDYVGLVLYTGGLSVFLIGVSWGGSTAHPWDSASTIVPIVVGFVSLAACFAYDFVVPKNPLFPFPLFRLWREYTILLSVAFVSGMVFYSAVALFPQGALYMFTSDVIEIGVIQLTYGASAVVWGGILTLFMGMIGHYKIQIIALLAMQTVFMGCMAAVPNHKAGWMTMQFFAPGPFPMINIGTVVVAGLNVPLRYLGVAIGVLNTFRSLGGAVGLSVFTSILKNVVQDQIPKRLAAVAIEHNFPMENLPALIEATVANAQGVPGAFASVPGINAALQQSAISALRLAYGVGFQKVFLSTIPFGVIATVLAFWIKDVQIYLTNHTAVRMEKDGLFGEKKVHKGENGPLA